MNRDGFDSDDRSRMEFNSIDLDSDVSFIRLGFVQQLYPISQSTVTRFADSGAMCVDVREASQMI